MKNIWIINHYSMPPEYETRVRNNIMAKYLIQKGYKVKIFAASTIHNTDINLIKDRKKLYIKKTYDGLDFVHIKTSNYSGNGISRIINMLQFPLRLLKVSKKIGEKPDVIICDLEAIFAWSPYLVAKRFKSKFILEVRDLWPESIVVYKNISKNNPIIRILYKVEKWIYKRSDKLVFSMEGGKDYIVNKGWNKDMNMSKIHYINNGVDLQQFNYNKENYITKDVDLDNEDTFKVVYAGSIRQANNVRKIVDVAETIKKKGNINIKFLIYGDGSDKEVLEKYCMEGNINNIVFKGHLEKNKIPYILSKCDLNIMHFSQSSLKKYGSSMNKMFDYLASGKPSLSDCEFGYDTFNGYKGGVSIDNANSEVLAENIIKFYNMPKEEYNNYCNNALKAAKDFDFKVLTDKLEKVILED
ncbi:glycosyltransferase family 4 protein [Clostridium algidicarnis]|uniref:Glycosyltransferase involved in cell wall biosynthesis n=1 Tax=Clostridium algidicarnis DSM 15099 TaxID=1121295 RepID=A0A2S6FUX6_9CLOT|nr:glycosyltransferase family 4 protein [Clostridium algidicarnis]PPK45274.1 glycosyltransferase involved in cell wall biosynthesis [Clostridium algidicarnis DSM 15099]